LSAPDPVEAFVVATRAALVQAGLERVVRADGDVYWRGGPNGAPVLVLLHGVNDQAGTWAAVAGPLAKRFRLLIPDLAGHGESEPKTGPIPLPLILQQLDALVSDEASGLVTLLGNSMGGWVAILYALQHPDCVGRLILEDASGMAWNITVPLFPQTREQAVIALHAVNGPHAETPDWAIDVLLHPKSVAPMARVAQTGLIPYLVDGRLGEIRVPTSLIWGADDGLLPVAYAEVLQKKIAGATLQIIDGAAHIPHRQQPEKFLACLNAIF
jgi:pimeloyl-ACP methyl ester carboxylesterase